MIGSGIPSMNNKMERIRISPNKVDEGHPLKGARDNDTVALATAKSGAQTGNKGTQ